MHILNATAQTGIPVCAPCVNVLIITPCQFTARGLLYAHQFLTDTSLHYNFTHVYEMDEELLAGNDIDIAIIDFDFNVENGLISFLVNRISEWYKTAVIALTSKYNIDAPLKYRRAGAKACIGKHMTTQEINSALTAVYRGEKWFSTGLTEPYLHSRLAQKSAQREQLYISLSACEQRVIKSVLKGISLTAFARKHHKSVKTVSTQKISAMKKLGAHNLMELNNSFGRLVG